VFLNRVFNETRTRRRRRRRVLHAAADLGDPFFELGRLRHIWWLAAAAGAASDDGMASMGSNLTI
jgi:hypothetical protein